MLSDKDVQEASHIPGQTESFDLKGVAILVCSRNWSWKKDVGNFNLNDVARCVQDGVPWEQIVARGANVLFTIPGDDATPHIDYATVERWMKAYCQGNAGVAIGASAGAWIT